MSGKEAIIDKILLDANVRANNIVEQAQLQAAEMVEGAKQSVANKKATLSNELQLVTKEAARRKQSVAELEVKKYNLKLKQQVLAETFDKAKTAIVNMDDAKYLKVISKVLNSYAEEGESVSISKNDKGRITQSFIDKVCPNMGLKLSEKFSDFDGGVVLFKGSYDKNLSLEVLLKLAREENESQIAKILFEVK